MHVWKSCLAVFIFTAFSFAQSNTNSTYNEGDRGLTFHAGAGYTSLVGPISHSLDNGWNVQAGGGYMFTPNFGLIGDYHYFGLGVPRSVLNSLSVPDGSAWVHALTFGPEIRLAPDSKIDPYIIGEAGWYRRSVQFTQPTTATVTAFDPFFGFFPAVIPANQVLGTVQRNGFGGNAGLGFAVRIRDGKAKLFAEGRYHYAMHARRDTQIVPFTVGIRW